MNGRSACAPRSAAISSASSSIEQAYNELRKTHARDRRQAGGARQHAADLEKLRDKVQAEDKRLGGQRAGDIAALLATIDLEAAAAVRVREARRVWQKRAPEFRRYRRAMNGVFKIFDDAVDALEQVKAMRGPARRRRSRRSPKRLARSASRRSRK